MDQLPASGYFFPFKYITSAAPMSKLISIWGIPYSPVTYLIKQNISYNKLQANLI